jgi:hypothetical protein
MLIVYIRNCEELICICPPKQSNISIDMVIVYIKNSEEWIYILILQKWNPQITCIVKKKNYS